MNDNSLHIEFLDGPRKGERLRFNNTEVFLGRAEHCDVKFDNPHISKSHARISLKGGAWVVTDQSTNGTLVSDNIVLRHDSRPLKSGDILRLSQSGDAVRISFSSVPSADDDPRKSVILPFIRSDFRKSVIKQPFFIFGLVTAIVGLLFFILGFAPVGTHYESIMFNKMYQLLLGLYIGGTMIIGVAKVSDVKIPYRYLLAPALLCIICIIAVLIPVHLLLFGKGNPQVATEIAASKGFFNIFFLQFFTVGIPEELVKAIPLFIALALSKKLAKKNIHGFKEGSFTTAAAIAIGTSSAVGFIVLETLGGYVPIAEIQGGNEASLMLLIPRFITGICGHVAWTGIFSYFIALGLNFRKRFPLFFIVGLTSAATLHALWNSFSYLNKPFVGSAIAIISFLIFIAYLYKAKEENRA